MRVRNIFIALSIVAVVSACTPQPEPTPSPTTSSPSPTATTNPESVALYYLADTQLGFRLFQETHTIETAESAEIAAVRAIIENSEAPLDPDYTNVWPSGSVLTSVVRSGDTVIIDVNPGQFSVGSEGEARAIDQVVWTLTANDPSITRVLFLIEGVTSESLAGHVDLSPAFTRGEGYEVLSPVMITSPFENQIMSGNVIVSGLACTFEANVAWRLYRNGEKIMQASTLAREACPVTSPWEVDLGVLDPGGYEFRAIEFSAKDGSIVVKDTRSFTVE